MMNFFKNLKNQAKNTVFLKMVFILSGVFLSFVLAISLYLSFLQGRRDAKARGARLADQFQSLVSERAEQEQKGEVTFHEIQLKRDPASGNQKVFFSYSLSLAGESGGENQIKGSALLEKSQDERDLWLVRDFHITDNSIHFENPLAIPAEQKQDTKK